MRSYINILFCIILLFGAFISCNLTNNNTEEIKKSNDTVSIQPPFLEKATKNMYSFTGNINANIPVFIWFKIYDSVIKGQVTYIKSKSHTPIEIRGIVSEDGIRIHEFEKDGNVTGTFMGKLTDDSFTGTWYGSKRDNEFTFQLQVKDTTLSTIDSSFEPLGLSGAYRYQFGNDGAQGSVHIDELANNAYSASISCVTSGPAYNLADLKIDSFVFANNSYNYKMAETDNCSFRIRIFKDFLVINYIGNQYDCGFGNNAFVEGVFLKTK